MSFLWHGLTEEGAQVPVQVDAQGRVIAVDGTPGTNYWNRADGTLSPVNAGDGIKADSTIASGDWDTSSSTASATRMLSGGRVDIQRALADGDSSTLLQGYLGQTNTVSITAGGSATFAGKVNVGGSSSRISDWAFEVFGDGNANGYALYQSGVHTTPSAPYVIRCNVVGVGDTVDIRADGAATFVGTVKADTRTAAVRSFHGLTTTTSISEAPLVLANGSNVGNVGNGYLISGLGPSNAQVFSLANNGNATFAGNITAANVTFRSADPQFYVKKTKNRDAEPQYIGPELDLLAEIARLEALVRHLYETLRITPPAGWPVWDGNDDVLRQLRK